MPLNTTKFFAGDSDQFGHFHLISVQRYYFSDKTRNFFHMFGGETDVKVEVSDRLQWSEMAALLTIII